MPGTGLDYSAPVREFGKDVTNEATATANLIGPSGVLKMTDKLSQISTKDEGVPVSNPSHLFFQEVPEMKAPQPIMQEIPASAQLGKSVADMCSERLQEAKKSIRANLEFHDKLDQRNPQLISDYAPDIFQHMRDVEQYYMVAPDYLANSQKEIKDTSRAFLVEWMADVHRKYKLRPDTLFLSVNACDRYMSQVEIPKRKLHILGMTSMMATAKYEEIYPPTLKDLMECSEGKFTREDVITMETKLLSTIDFDFMSPTTFQFLKRFEKMISAFQDPKVFYFSRYLSEICLLDASLLKFPPSVIALSCLSISAKTVTGYIYKTNQITSMGITEDQLQLCMKEVRSFVKEVNPKFTETLLYKFNKPDYYEVAKIPLTSI